MNSLINQNLFKLTRKSNKKIFFLHIPKCGGTSIAQAIHKSFGYFEKPNLFHLDSEASIKASKVIDEPIMVYREKILLYYMSQSNCKYINGHFKYSEKAFQEFGKEWYFITILRNPVSKWFSQYFFNRYKKNQSYFSLSVNLEEFLESDTGVNLGSDYVRKLTSFPAKIDYTCDDAIQKAINNLKQFNLVGLIEYVDIFAQEYYELFGNKIVIKHNNSNPRSKAKQQEEITDDIRKRVEEICQPDIKVYQYVLEQIKTKYSLS